MMLPYWTCCSNSRHTPRPPRPRPLHRPRSLASLLLSLVSLVRYLFLTGPDTDKRRPPDTRFLPFANVGSRAAASGQHAQAPPAQQRIHEREVRRVIVTVGRRHQEADGADGAVRVLHEPGAAAVAVEAVHAGLDDVAL